MEGKGRLFVIEGIDGAGKSTQVELLRKRFLDMGLVEDKDFCTLHFPRYGTTGATMVEKYLHGELGSLDDLDPYLVSTWYTTDRALSEKYWREIYDNGGIVILDRYTQSNIIHQGSKLIDPSYFTDLFVSNTTYDNAIWTLSNYTDWLYTLEYDNIGLPKPDLVIYLDTSIDLAIKNMEKRGQVEETKDLHEKNKQYLINCATTAQLIYTKVDTELWRPIFCEDDKKLIPSETIHGYIWKYISSMIEDLPIIIKANDSKQDTFELIGPVIKLPDHDIYGTIVEYATVANINLKYDKDSPSVNLLKAHRIYLTEKRIKEVDNRYKELIKLGKKNICIQVYSTHFEFEYDD